LNGLIILDTKWRDDYPANLYFSKNVTDVT